MPNHPNKLLSGVYRISDYLDKQAIREKEKKKEKLLSVLPRYIEQQLSGIEDEKSLLEAVPRLSAELYGLGADVGAAASQILGNFAQTKFRELNLGKQDKQLEDTLGILSDANKGFTFNYRGNPNATFSDILGTLKDEGVSHDVIARQIGTILEATITKKTGNVSEGKDGDTYYNEYIVDAKGNTTIGNTFRINRDDRGKRTMDLLGPDSPEIDQFPLTSEGFAHFAAEDKFDKQLGKELGLILTRDRVAEEREARKRKAALEGLKLYDRKTDEQVFATADESGRPIYYKDKSKFGTPTGALPDVTQREYITDLSDIEEVGQLGRQEKGLAPGEINQDVKNKNRVLKSIGEQILASKVPESGGIWTGAVDEDDIKDKDPRTGALVFYNRTKIEEVVKQSPNHIILYLGVEMKLIDAWNIYLDLETKSQISTTGLTPGKIDYDKAIIP